VPITREAIARAQQSIPTNSSYLNDFIREVDRDIAPGITARYVGRNRIIDSDDLRPLFLERVLEVLPTVNLDRGDPVKYLISQARSRFLAFDIGVKIKAGTEQICRECSHRQRITYTGNMYSCPHPYNECNYCVSTFIADDKGAMIKKTVPARTHHNDEPACRTAKSLNRFFYCMKDYRAYIDMIVEDCTTYKGFIINRMMLAGITEEDAEIQYAERMKRTHIESMYHLYLPDRWGIHRHLLTRVKRLTVGRKPVCRSCGSTHVSTIETSTSDNLHGDDSDSSRSIAEDMTQCVDTDHWVANILDGMESDKFIMTLHGRVKDVMSLLIEGLCPADIATKLDISRTAVNTYKNRGFRAALDFFHDEWLQIVGLKDFNRAYARYENK